MLEWNAYSQSHIMLQPLEGQCKAIFLAFVQDLYTFKEKYISFYDAMIRANFPVFNLHKNSRFGFK